MNDRNMYYNYGYTKPPLNNINPGINLPIPQENTYASSQINDMNDRLNRLERQLKRIDQRLTRLETPYANNNKIQNEPDNNMYIM